ncbi:MAG: PQQ-dependent sugar dehydrogenase, partial [Verrucomicrobiales bacterium]|nr:PQQ-dependent sugar dehydrogenase [Verrucomicrobiales bacterium]
MGAQHAALPAGFAEAASGAKKLQLSPGLKLDVWAAEPQLSNSVAFCLDGRGRVFLAESDRWAISVFDITAHTNWLWQDMSFRTVADRAAFLTNEFSTNLTLLTKDSEAVRMLEDSTGSGHADRSVVVASGFNSVVDGTAAGILATRDRLYFANIPNLWSLQPVPPAGAGNPPKVVAESLGFGFGVHIGVSGHDLHGLIKGPDGRIYLSFGDRGCVLTNREGVTIHLPDTGGVLRCEPDGRNLEVFCYGLRNPQELAFDDLGNLWTVDNDTAGADPCRVLHLVEGADYGWRTSYQHMDGFGPWVQEELWKGGQDGILPPAGTVSQGPAGLAFYPGTGFGERLKGTFLHADFPGGVWAFTVKPQGASYVVDHKEKFLWNCWPTDVDFGPDGAAYVLDWVSGWGQTPRGRIYRITPSDAHGRDGVSPSPSSSADRIEAERVAQVRRLLAEGMALRAEKELLSLLGNPDRRVRLEAQWELAGRGSNSLSGFVRVATGGPALLPRLHALWGIAQILRDLPMTQGAEELASLLPLLDDPEPEIRGQAARVLLGDGRLMNAEQPVRELFGDPSPSVRRMAVQAFAQRLRTPGYGPGVMRVYFSGRQKVLGTVAAGAGRVVGPEQQHRLEMQLGTTVAGSYPVIELAALVGKAEGDLFLLDAVAGFFASHGTSSAVFADQFVRSESPELRKVAVSALRRLTNRLVTNFLTDPDPGVVIAAGRAIHDVPIVSGFPALASFITKVDCPTNLYSRVIDACYRLGTQQHAQMLAGFAAREDVPDWARVIALRTLGDWEKPAPLDRVNGLWRPLVTLAAENQEQSPGPSPATSGGNPLLERAAQAQAGRNLGRAAEVPKLPADLGRSVSYAEAMALRRNPAPARRAYLRVAGDLLNPFNLNEAGAPAGTREVLPLQIAVAETAARLGVKEAGTPLYEKFSDPKTPGALRQAIVPALAALKSPMAGDAVKAALADPDPKLRAAAIPYVDRLDG